MSYKDEKWWFRCITQSPDSKGRIDTGEGEHGTDVLWLELYPGGRKNKERLEEATRYVCAAVNFYQKHYQEPLPTNEDVVVTGFDLAVRREATCQNCGAILSYLPKAVQSGTECVMGETEHRKYITCPNCDKVVVLERT